MTSDNDKKQETPAGISGVSGPEEIDRGHFFLTKSPILAGSSGETWTHQAKPVGVLGAGAAFVSINPEGVVLNFDEYSSMQSGIGDIEAELSEIRKQLAEKTTAVGEAEKDIEKRKELEKRYIRLLELYGVLTQIHPAAGRKLLERGDNDLKNWLDKETIGSEKAFVISIDIRRSTELMLKAREPELFASFVTELCNGLRDIILDQFGIFDKFTGDGVLAFFPEFYTGEDAGYRAISAASKSHMFFEETYKENRNCFKTVLKDTGLGIGIDYGTIHMVKANSLITAVGEPVVYACRFGGGKPGITLLNQLAHEQIAGEFSAYCNIEDTEIKTKEGRMLAYSVKLLKEKEDIATPSWYQIKKSNGEIVEQKAV